jgi:tetratricopeptide (TPR) repeat protein
MYNESFLYLVIALGGTVGGLLYGMRDKKLILPHWEDKHIWNPGLLADILFGLAGAFVIFIVIPGTFDYQAGGWETIQILALAGVGGYGGRAVVEKLVNEQLQQLERSVQELRKHERWDAVAIKLVDKHLDDDPDTPQIPRDELFKAISSASSSAKVLIFDKARDFRKECLVNDRKRRLINQAIPVMEGLIADDKEQKYHRNHGQLGFILKDMSNPEWKRAEEEFSKAIEIRNRSNEQGYLAYEFNRAICRIRLGYKVEDILPDLEAALKADKTVDWVRHPDPGLAHDLVLWLKENGDRLMDWINVNKIELPK